MENLDIDSMLKVLESPAAGKNIEGIMDAMDEVQKLMSKGEHLMASLDRMGMKAGLMRILGVKFGVDVDSPLGGEKAGFQATSDFHELVYKQMNGMSEVQISQMLQGGAAEVEVVEHEEPDQLTE